MVYFNVLYISERRRGPKRRGARGSLPPTPPSRWAWWKFRDSSLLRFDTDLECDGQYRKRTDENLDDS